MLTQLYKRRKFWAAILAALFLVLGILSALFPPPVKALRHVSPVVQDAEGRWLAGFTVEGGTWRIPADIDRIDPRFTSRLIAIEDSRFYDHSGVDIPAIMRAARSWARAGEPVSGASTLTMQLIRQLEPRPRTMRSKVIESLRAMQLELYLSKDEILAAYLTHVPYGGNVEGVEAASRLYFGKAPEQLTDGEIALLIALPQAPEARRPDRHMAAAKSGRDGVLDKLLMAGLMSPLAVTEAKSEPLPNARFDMAERAWITARGLSQADSRLRSTLDYDLQYRLEGLSVRIMDRLPSPTNIAVTVVDNRTMAVRAHLASSDRTRPGGWIDMTARDRSPGSTLKPFIYALAMDDGILSAGTRLDDAPTRFGTYRPENFNRRYHGSVRVDEALRHSLNVPAVAVLDRLGGVRLEDSFTDVGIHIARPGGRSDRAGLALALGGAGMSVNDVAMLYAGLANGGQVRPLRWREDDLKGDGKAIMSPHSARDITRILRQAPTPAGHVPGWLKGGGVDIAYKTGTSYGFRDAWAAGYTDDWTVVVWVGRPDGAPRMGKTGRDTAAPILFDIMGLLPQNSLADSYARDDDAPRGLAALSAAAGPQILFPPDGAEIYASELGDDARGFTLSVRSESGAQLFIDDVPLSGNVWRPSHAGFYSVTAIDALGQSARSNVRIVGRDGIDRVGFSAN